VHSDTVTGGKEGRPGRGWWWSEREVAICVFLWRRRRTVYEKPKLDKNVGVRGETSALARSRVAEPYTTVEAGVLGLVM